MSGDDWIAANQRVLVAEFARLKAQLAGKDVADAARAGAAARAAMQPAAAIDVIAAAFGLSDFERDILLLCAGVEMDPPLAAACALHGETAHSPYPTFNLALAKFAEPHWSALAPVRPLRAWRLVEVRDERALASSRLCIDERILHFLAGINFLDPRLRPLLRPAVGEAPPETARLPAVDQAVERIAAGGAAVLQLVGDDIASQVDVARQIAARLERSLHTMRAADIPASAHEADAFATLWQRESILLTSALLVRVEDTSTHGDSAICRATCRNGIHRCTHRDPAFTIQRLHTHRAARRCGTQAAVATRAGAAGCATQWCPRCGRRTFPAEWFRHRSGGA